ncbi:MAG: type II secretion system F family protein [Acidimicrobiales bacterium]
MNFSLTTVLAAVGVALGLALAVTGLLMRARERDNALAAVLDLPWGERDVDVSSVTESSAGLLSLPMGVADAAVERLDAAGKLALRLERARILLSPGELVVFVASLSLIGGVVIALASGEPLLGIIALIVGPVIANIVINRRVDKRRRAFEAQLPGALSLIGASLSGGHTFLRSIQMMCEEATAPLSEEFSRVVNETRLGDPLLDSLRRMAVRMGVKDLDWVVQAIYIQQSTGGRLAELLHTLTDYIRSREEVSREVKVLTAENRISAAVLAALPVFLLLVISLTDPGYVRPFYHGIGILALIGTGLLVALGGFIIMRMARIEI